MSAQILQSRSKAHPDDAVLGVADCDIHPVPNSMRDLYPYLDRRWHGHVEMFGARRRQGPQFGPVYPKGQPEAARRDAWPPGKRPGASLEFMQQQHLDPNNVQLGILTVINPHPGSYQDPDQSVAFCRAVNDWQKTEWTQKDPRLKASIMVPFEDPPEAVREIERLANDDEFAQVFFLSRTTRPLGDRLYWPIYEAATAANLPVGIHAFGNSGFPITSSGWPSYYIEEMVGHAQSCQSQLTSLVLSGVFEAFPLLRVVFIESGFGWVPSLSWRLDTHWKKLKEENSLLKLSPSEYIRRNVWFTTQPMEEPDKPEHLATVFEWIGWDRLLYSSDYPHWDFDDPAQCLPFKATPDQKAKLFLYNALSLYGRG